jgi:signal transduction histidine kinase
VQLAEAQKLPRLSIGHRSLEALKFTPSRRARRILGEKGHRRLLRDNLIICGVENLKAEAVLFNAKIDDLGEVANVDMVPAVSLPRERVGESRRKSRIVRGLGDDPNPKRVDVGACAGSKGSRDLFANELRKAVVLRRVGVIAPRVQCDRVQLQQVMLNLIVNAIQSMSRVEDGNRELHISTARIEPVGVCVAVRDTGPGLRPESLPRLFEPFYTTKSDGMGLSICRSIIEAHGGRLWAARCERRDASFSLRSP